MRRWWILPLLGGGCDAQEAPPVPGVHVEEGPCGRALYVIATDYQSSSVSVVGWDGAVLGRGLIDSGSEDAGLSVALSGDVVAPTDRVGAPWLLLLDRYPASVVTIVDPARAAVDRQINVQTGFASNPQDALLARPGALYVTRYERNPAAGAAPFDAGSDVLVVDVEAGAPIGRVDLAPAMAGAPAGILPRPWRMLARGGYVYVLLGAYSASFSETADARVAVIDPETDRILHHVVLAGSRGCAGLAASPDASRLAVTCSGTFAGTSTPSLAGAGVYLLDRAPDGALTPRATFPAAAFGHAPPSFSADFSGEAHLLFATFGELDDLGAAVREDLLLDLDLDAGTATEVLSSDGAPFSLGDVRCGPACGACFVADAARGVVHRLSVEAGGAIGASREVALDDGTGLPPRYLGAY